MKESKQRKYDIAYLKMAQEWAKLSYCKRKQVGALIVKDKKIIVQNGMFFMQKLTQL